MRAIFILAAILAGLGIAMSLMADKYEKSKSADKIAVASAKPMVPSAPASSPSTGYRTHTIHRDQRGHFQTDARIEGRSVSFMVDTGASVVALTEKDAALIGVRPSFGDYTVQVSTANGTVKAARARLVSVDIGGLVVRDVDALVLPDTALRENLLGLSYLSRLKRFEYANGRLVLEQ
jgi:aspartyl protease family protein